MLVLADYLGSVDQDLRWRVASVRWTVRWTLRVASIAIGVKVVIEGRTGAMPETRESRMTVGMRGLASSGEGTGWQISTESQA